MVADVLPSVGVAEGPAAASATPGGPDTDIGMGLSSYDIDRLDGPAPDTSGTRAWLCNAEGNCDVCMRPYDPKVMMVPCHCGKWFHARCILTALAVTNDLNTFRCWSCTTSERTVFPPTKMLGGKSGNMRDIMSAAGSCKKTGRNGHGVHKEGGAAVNINKGGSASGRKSQQGAGLTGNGNGRRRPRPKTKQTARVGNPATATPLSQAVSGWSSRGASEALDHRHDKSLGVLCRHFLGIYEAGQTVVLTKAVEQLSEVVGYRVERRRFYDLVHVLDSVAVLKRVDKSIYTWLGLGNLGNGLRGIMERGSGVRPGDENNTLAVMTRAFLKLFLKELGAGRRSLPLDEVMQRLECSNEGGGSHRRLYDIANILVGVNIIEKTRLPGNKRAYKWTTIDPNRPEGPDNCINYADLPDPAAVAAAIAARRVAGAETHDTEPTPAEAKKEDTNQKLVTPSLSPNKNPTSQQLTRQPLQPAPSQEPQSSREAAASPTPEAGSQMEAPETPPMPIHEETASNTVVSPRVEAMTPVCEAAKVGVGVGGDGVASNRSSIGIQVERSSSPESASSSTLVSRCAESPTPVVFELGAITGGVDRPKPKKLSAGGGRRKSILAANHAFRGQKDDNVKRTNDVVRDVHGEQAMQREGSVSCAPGSPSPARDAVVAPPSPEANVAAGVTTDRSGRQSPSASVLGKRGVNNDVVCGRTQGSGEASPTKVLKCEQ